MLWRSDVSSYLPTRRATGLRRQMPMGASRGTKSFEDLIPTSKESVAYGTTIIRYIIKNLTV